MNGTSVIDKKIKKYINNEEVLYKYSCMTSWMIIRYFIFFIGLFISYKYVQTDRPEVFIFILFIASIWFFTDIKTFLNRGIYLTKNNIITFSGKTIPLKNIYYKSGAGGAEGYGSSSFKLYENKNLLVSCLVKDTDNYNEMIKILEEVSGNKNLKNISKRDGRRKLINDV